MSVQKPKTTTPPKASVIFGWRLYYEAAVKSPTLKLACPRAFYETEVQLADATIDSYTKARITREILLVGPRVMS